MTSALGAAALAALTTAALVPGSAAAPAPQGTDAMPEYRATAPMSGRLRIAGSATASPALNRWSAGYRGLQAGASIEIASGGTGTAVEALANGSADIGVVSRPLRTEEIAAFRRAHGHDPIVIDVALDAIAIYVNRNNPLDTITLTQLDAAFSATRTRGGAPPARWADLGVGGSLAEEPLRLHGVGPHTGGHGLVRDVVLRGGEFRSDVATDAAPNVITAVGTHANALGYASQSLASRRVKALAVASDGGRPVAPTAQSISDGTYPLAHRISVVVNRRPGTATDPLLRDFLRYVLSREGQRRATESGLVALDPATVLQGRSRLD